MIHRQSDDRLQSKSGRLPIYLNVRCNALVSWLTTKPSLRGRRSLTRFLSAAPVMWVRPHKTLLRQKPSNAPLSSIHTFTQPLLPILLHPDPPLKASTSTKGYKDEVQQPTKSTSLPKNGEKS